MQQRVEPGKVENLSRNLEHLRQTIEHSLTGLSNELTRLLSSVESAYSESYVRAAAREVSEQLHEIMKFAEALDERMRDKVKVLNYAANEYLQIEKKAVGLAKASKPAYFTLKGAAQALLKGFKDRALQNIGDSGDPSSKSKLSLVQIAKGVLLEFREMSLESRVAPVKEDARIAALLLMMETGTVEDQAWAREKLDEIAKAFEELARQQAAYQVYEIYGNEMYTGYVHKLADKQRSILADLGISEKWYKTGVSLAAFYKGSPLTACDYNPLKHDFSTMPSESELRMVIAVGLYNEVYRNWARNSYSRIEAAVHQAAEQQRKLEEQLEEYNRLVPEEDIRKMQQVLKDLNIYQGEVTGKYNEELLIAVAGYQHIANTISSVAAVWRSQSKSGKYEFEVDGKVTKELLELALAEKGLGIRNNPDLVINNGGTITAITMVGVGDGIVSQLKEDFGDVLKGSWANNPNNIEFWTKTLPHYYDLAKDIENGNITYDSIKSMLGEELAKEFIVPFKDIKNLSGKVLSGKASYEESVSYGRALAKAASAVMLVKAAATAGAKGAKLASKSSKELLESLPKITEQFRRYEFVTPEGIRVKVPAWEADGTISYSKNPNQVQQNFIENYLKEREGKGRVEGTGNLIFKSDYDDHLVNVKKFDRDPSKGITGGHNMDEFYKYFRNVLKLDDVDFINKVTPHPTIDGIIQINYKIPKLDNKGNLTGEYKYFKNPKTVYDPSKISEVTIIEWGKAAMQQGIDAGSIVGRRITGIAPNGLKFEGYMDENGVITNFYPKLD
ncbi:CdiA family toxin C-terminal domain-containing protein [Paenibacillus vini]|uniref:Bacterial EndoU nuclease domain-containing protein n=1 Tax=Paenibacillus vini TaxID=1476024 RepID=A0ABQ4MJD3_9BACL|nr:EndoU domain-containing protein [Paenibacillus vini]GIP56091.1 hypothetical protein J42TS3_51260 [Paenibacillus vini]